VCLPHLWLAVSVKTLRSNQLITVTISASVTSIGNGAFLTNQLESVAFSGDYFDKFVSNAFTDNTSLSATMVCEESKGCDYL
jgi:hypothetical protein